MTSANVSQIPFGFMENTKAKSAAKSEANSGDFMQMVTNSLQSTDQKKDMISTFAQAPQSDNKEIAPQQSFNQTDYSARTIPNNNQTSQQMSPETVDEAIEKVDKFISEVKSILSEDMNVSDEEIIEAMEILGFNMIDLTLPENVSKLLGVLEGDENVSLILNDTVSNVLSDLEPVISNLFETMEVTNTNALKNLLAENDLVVTYDGLAKAPVDFGPNGEVNGVELSQEETVSLKVLNTDPLILKESNQAPITEEPTDLETPVDVKAPLVSEETKVKAELENFDFEDVQEMETDKAIVSAPKPDLNSNSENFLQNQNGKKSESGFEPTAVTNTSVHYSTSVTNDSTISFENVVKESTTSYTSIDVEDIMNQTNIGAIFRSAAALGMDAILLTPGCSDPLYRRSVRVSMGTVFQIPWAYLPCGSPEYVSFLKEKSFRTAAMALRNDTVCIDDNSLSSAPRLAVILGTEGEGLKEATVSACDDTVKIPMFHGVDSLNVAAASAVAFWELRKK